MPSTYSNLKIQLMATGENATTWGDVTNVNLGTALEEAIAGSADVTFASNNQTLTLTDTNATQTARNLRLRCTGTTGGSTRDLVVPTIEKPYIVQNNCADSVVVKTSAGTGVTVPAGKTMWVYADGTNVVDATTHLTSLTLGTAFANGLGAVDTPSYTFTGDLNTGMWSPAADTLALSTAGGERVRINASGNVGIGTNSPASLLHVEGGSIRTNVSYIVSGAGELKTSLAGNGIAINNTGMNGIAFETGGTPAERMRINSAGNVGIGTTNPLFPLHVNGEVRGTKFTSDAASQSLANATNLAVLTLTGNPGPQVYLVSVGVNASGGIGNTVALVTVGTDGSGGRNASVTQLVNGTNTDVAVTNVAGTSTVNVQQSTGITQTISWSITRLM